MNPERAQDKADQIRQEYVRRIQELRRSSASGRVNRTQARSAERRRAIQDSKESQ